MKKILFSASFLLLFAISGCAQKNDEVVGVNEEGTFKITSSLKTLKTEWADQLKQLDISSPIRGFEILSSQDKGSGNETYYYLLGTTEDKITKMATLLRLENGKFFFLTDEGDSPTGTVTCTGCAFGCNPEKVGSKWYCSGGCGSDCKKTVTVATRE